MPRKSTEPRVACHHCRKWMYYGKGVEHMYAGVPHRVHRECHLWLLRREKTKAVPVEKEVTLTDIERDVLALWLQTTDRPYVQSSIKLIAQMKQCTYRSAHSALLRCQNKFGADSREQLREVALAAGYGVVNQGGAS